MDLLDRDEDAQIGSNYAHSVVECAFLFLARTSLRESACFLYVKKRLPCQKGENMKVGIIGGGRVGSRLGKCLHTNNCLVGITAASYEHNKQLAASFDLPLTDNYQLWEKADVILITVPDRLIKNVADSLSDKIKNYQDKIVLHCSGSLDLAPLAALNAKGIHTGSLHPLQSFVSSDTNLKGVYMAIAGDDVAQKAAFSLVNMFQGHGFYVPDSERAAYHAAACVCSNYIVTIEKIAQNLLSKWLGSDEQAWSALKPLFLGTVNNLCAAKAINGVLTGPIARGDIDTVTKHLQILPGKYLPLYCNLAQATAILAKEENLISQVTFTDLNEILEKVLNKKEVK